MSERNYGTSLLEIIGDFTVVDIETTGLDPRYDDIIELGALKVRNGEVVETYNQLIKPKFPVDDFITDLTGITNDMLKDAPPIESKIEEFVNFIGDDILLGHNIRFDISFIYRVLFDCHSRCFGNDYIDTLRLSRKVVRNLEHHRLVDMIEYYRIDVKDRHRSIGDCYATLEVYDRLCKDVEVNGIDLHATSHHSHSKLRAKDILALTEPNEDSPIFNQVVVFTGTLERMIRKDAMQIVANLGGINGDGVTKKTNFLVLGNDDYGCKLTNGKSTKYLKAEELIKKGANLQIISEDVFFDMIEQ